jgi:hypothetical protein
VKSLCRLWLLCHIILMVVLFNTLPNVYVLALWYTPVTLALTFCLTAFFRFILSSDSGHTHQPSP